MKIDFYFDPICPFCWITSRWLIQVKDQRGLVIAWKPFSLALKNKQLDTPDSELLPSHRVLRVMVASGADMGELYTAFGTQKHIMGEEFNNEAILQILNKQKLPAELLLAADDSSYDETIQQFMEEALSLTGNDVGVPIISFTTEHGKVGYFGPVLQKLPSVTESLKLWDGLQTLATSPHFYELKRSRPNGDPEVASTAICVP